MMKCFSLPKKIYLCKSIVETIWQYYYSVMIILLETNANLALWAIFVIRLLLMNSLCAVV